MRRNIFIFLLLSAFIFVMAEVPSVRFGSVLPKRVAVRDTVPPTDSIRPERDTLPEREIRHERDTLPERDSRPEVDTLQMDSLQLLIYKRNQAIDDSLHLDSLNRKRKNGIDAPVQYTAKDSMVYDASTGYAYLYGNAEVKYENMDLTADQIYMNLDSSLVHAQGTTDTLGVTTGSPVFKMGSDTYESGPMAFNFKTKKGIISDVCTQQEDGFLTSEKSKRGSEGELYLQHGRYTTCDEDHPDFYLALSRAKVRPGKDVVFGPAYLVVADVPLPFAIPYGFFPFTKSYSSGFIMPTYGDETSRGFYLRQGGYYFAISDKMDLKVVGDIYTKGSWGIDIASNYCKRYKYSGSVLVSYQNTVTGEKNTPDYQKSTSFKVIWNHTQDPKANPFQTFSARVNFATQSYEQNNLNSMYNPQALTQTTRTSSVTWGTTFSSLNMSLSSTFNIEQNMRDSMLTLRLPDLSVTVSDFKPFKRKNSAGEERWYEKISVRYTGSMTNYITAKEDKVFHSSLSKDWQNGIKHVIPVQATFNLFNVLNVTPNFTFTDRMYLSKYKRSWDDVRQREVVDTLQGFYNVYDWNANLTLTTKIYGFFTPNRKLFGDKVQAIRHVLTPTVSFSYAPDFGASRYGYWETYQKTDADGNVTMVEYSPYQGTVYSVPGKGKTGSVRFDLANNLEMKVKSDEDSTGFKKISLIDELRLGMSYNFAAERQPLSPLSMSLRLKLSKSYTLNLSTTFASYVYEADSVGGPVRESDHVTYWQKGKFGRFQSLSQSFHYTLDTKKIGNFFRWLRGESTDDDDDDKAKDEDYDDMTLEANMDTELERGKHAARKKKDKAETDDDGYMTFSMPWSLTFGYTIAVHENRAGTFNYKTMRYPYKLTQTLNVSGNLQLSEGWNINFSSGYDFENKKISMTTASLSRDLHCFNMSCSVTLAPYTSYNFSFRCNAATLTDALKYDKRSSFSNAVQWY